ncbi:MAG TPA: GNAT family protein [Gaiellaceae bacterium]|nr:GNAT family protein [Gaiellaceae bacterium]
MVTQRLVARCWEPADAPLLKEAVDSSLEHLRPWMPWARDEPQTLPQKVQLLRAFRGQFDRGENFVYGLFSADESEVVGGSGLHPRAGDCISLEIGYWIRASAIGRGYATEASAALARVGFEVCGADRIDIRVDPANERSAAVPRKLGFVEEARLRRRLISAPGEEPRDALIFSLFRDGLSGSPVAAAQVEAFDAAGTRVL